MLVLEPKVLLVYPLKLSLKVAELIGPRHLGQQLETNSVTLLVGCRDDVLAEPTRNSVPVHFFCLFIILIILVDLQRI